MAEITEVIHKISYEVNDDALVKQYEQVLKLSQYLDKMSASAAKSGVAAKGMGKSFGKAFGKANWVGLAVEAGKILAKVAEQSVKAALAAEDVEIAFGNLNKPLLLDELRKQTQGLISDVELMQQAVNANNLGLNVEQLGTALHYAQIEAKATGRSVEELANELKVGLSTGSDRILENMGVNVKRINIEFKNTGDYASAAAKVINEQLQESGGNVATYGDEVDKLSAKWENLKVKIGKELLNPDSYLYKGILATNPLTLPLAIHIHQANAQRRHYKKSIASFDEYIKEYHKRDKNGKLQLLNTIANYSADLEKREKAEHDKGITRWRGYYANLRGLVENFYRQTIDTETKKTITSLNSLNQQIKILTDQRSKQDIGSDKFKNTTKEIERIQAQIDEALGRNRKGGGKTSDDIYNGQQAAIDKEAAHLQKTDEQLKTILADKIELEKKYKELYESDIESGRKISEEERQQREESYNDALERLNYREEVRLNQLDQDAINKKIQLAKTKKKIDDAAVLEQELLQSKYKASVLEKQGAEFNADRYEEPLRLKTLSEFQREQALQPQNLEKVGEPENPLKQMERDAEERKKKLEALKESYKEFGDAVKKVFDEIHEAQISKLDKEVEQRKASVAKAEKLAERGNSELLRIEEERLQKAEAARAKAAQKQMQLNALLQASNAALALTEAIVAVAKAAGGGDAYTVLPRIIAAVGGMVAGVVTLTNAFGDAASESFATGVVDYKGVGGPRDDKNWVRISSGESIITAAGTQKNRALLEAINDGAMFHHINAALPLTIPQFSQPSIVNNSYATNADLKVVSKKLDDVVGAIEDNRMKQNIFFNEQGVGVMTERAVRKNKRRFK